MRINCLCVTLDHAEAGAYAGESNSLQHAVHVEFP